MKSYAIDRVNKEQPSRKQEIDWLELILKVWMSRKLIFKVCCIGVIIGLVIFFSIPKEYTADILIAPESTRRSSSSGVSALADMADMDFKSSTTTEKDAIYPSLYPAIVNSTPFLIRLFDIKVREQKSNTTMTLTRYLSECQKVPWWRIITSAPSRLIGRTMSLFRNRPKEVGEQIKTKIDPFQLTRKEAGMAGVIASKIRIGVDKKKRVITVFVTMQDPLVAAIVADTVRVHLQEYITEYRTVKARRLLKYTEQLRNEAQAEYYEAQNRYTRYADVNQGLTKFTSRAELISLQNEMNLAHSTYNQMEKQVRAAQAKVEKVTPVYAVIQPVQVPINPSKPNKVIILMTCIFLSGVGAVTWILFVKDFVKSVRKKNNSFREMKADD